MRKTAASRLARGRAHRGLVRLEDSLLRRKRLRAALGRLRAFSARLSRELGLRRQYFDVTLVNDDAIAALNQDFRGKSLPTDVLSFPAGGGGFAAPAFGLEGFLGDIVISADTAKLNARSEGVPLQMEIQQLILHGALHLMGYDHETDGGEMNALELALRKTLKIEGERRKSRKKAQAASPAKVGSRAHEIEAPVASGRGSAAAKRAAGI